MNKIIFIALALLFAKAVCIGQSNIPKIVKKSFSQKFPNANKLKWDKENATEYEANFVLNGKSHSANFKNTGEWLETESEITYQELPLAVQNALQKAFRDKTLKLLAKIEAPNNKISYEAEIRKKAKTKEYFYNSDGSQIIR